MGISENMDGGVAVQARQVLTDCVICHFTAGSNF
jgi:hypothetical protein